jgi:hypothetical protein
MPSYNDEDYPQVCVIDVPARPGEGGPQLDDYLAESTQKLESISELAARGEGVDLDSRAWMLAQVDFIVETIGDDTLELGDEMRSNFLQLMLAIANLNEQIRHDASVSL